MAAKVVMSLMNDFVMETTRLLVGVMPTDSARILSSRAPSMDM